MKMIAQKGFSTMTMLFLSLILFACSGGSSSNGGSSNDNANNSDNTVDIQQECSEEFGDASRCEIREGL